MTDDRPRILVFAGSSRRDSFNRKLAAVAAGLAGEAGADVTHINLGDFPMPLFNQDDEAEHGMPEHAGRLKRLMIEHDGFIIASPEYNSAFSPLLKNCIDWVSRSEPDEDGSLNAYRGKFAAIMAASPGALGGLRGLVMLRMLLSNLSVHVIPSQLAISQAFKAFDDDGNLVEERKLESVRGIVTSLVDLVSKARAS